ncbi:MAG: glycosyltransferase family 39 protein [Armatimonadetes bacterium]|nr:glycosyltransferase family 39 protein [Armatimonadota bacterium]
MIDSKAGRAIPNWLLWLTSALPLLGFWLTGVLDLDEGFYSAAAGEMARRGEWITPFYNGSPWFEKPILVYWLAIPSINMFGEMVGPRLPSALCTLLVGYVVFSYTRRALSELAAQIALLLYSGSLLVGLVGRSIMTDVPLVTCEIIALFTFYRSLTEHPKWRLATAAALGLSTLAKGPVGCILFVLAAALTYWQEPELRPKFKGYWLLGTVIFAAVVASWYVPAYLVNRQVFIDKFLIEQNLKRFTGGDAAHTVTGLNGILLYVGVILVGAFPWILCLPQSWKIRSEHPFLRLCARWSIVVIAFFMISAAKLPHYVLPAFPTLAIIVGFWMSKQWESKGHPVLDFTVFWRYALPCLATSAILNFGIYQYYSTGNLFGKQVAPPHKEIHDLARWAKIQQLPIAVYQMPRRSKALGTGQLKLQETSHPSIAFYAQKPVLMTESLLEASKLGPDVVVLTRKGRITESDVTNLESANLDLRQVKNAPKSEFYQAWIITQIVQR